MMWGLVWFLLFFAGGEKGVVTEGVNGSEILLMAFWEINDVHVTDLSIGVHCKQRILLSQFEASCSKLVLWSTDKKNTASP